MCVAYCDAHGFASLSRLHHNSQLQAAAGVRTEKVSKKTSFTGLSFIQTIELYLQQGYIWCTVPAVDCLSKQ